MTTPRDSYACNYRDLATFLTLSESLVEGEECRTLHKLQFFGMNENLWDRVRGLDGEILKVWTLVKLLGRDVESI